MINYFDAFDAILASAYKPITKQMILSDKEKSVRIAIYKPGGLDRFMLSVQSTTDPFLMFSFHEQICKDLNLGDIEAYEGFPMEIWDDVIEYLKNLGFEDISDNYSKLEEFYPRELTSEEDEIINRTNNLLKKLHIYTRIDNAPSNSRYIENVFKALDTGMSEVFIKKGGLDEAERILDEIKNFEITEDLEKCKSILQALINKLAATYNNNMGNTRLEGINSAESLKETIKKIVAQETASLQNARKTYISYMENLGVPPKIEQGEYLPVLADKSKFIIKKCPKNLASKIKQQLDVMAGNVGYIWQIIDLQNAANYQANKNSVSGKHKKEKLLFHGSRNRNWLGILHDGLKLKVDPSSKSGAYLGDGLYFTDIGKDATTYSSGHGGRWDYGSFDTSYIAVYVVRIGDQLEATKSFHYTKEILDDENKDSVFYVGGKFDRSYTIYDKNQCTIVALIELKNTENIGQKNRLYDD